MTDILLLSATELEHGVDNLGGVPIHIIGVGKISSAINTTKLVEKYKPKLVINFGSCGNLQYYEVGDLIEVGRVVNDIDARPFTEYGKTPFSDWGSILISNTPITCFSTDYFFNIENKSKYSDKYIETITTCDVIDMELYSIAQVCKSYNIPLKSFKWVSDDGSSKDWADNAKIGFDKFQKYFTETCENGKKLVSL
jgi:adenosylhomocysteine nucleosidase